MRQSEVKGILDRWVIGTSGRSYMAGLENRPVIARAEGSTVYDTEGRAYPRLRFRPNGRRARPQPSPHPGRDGAERRDHPAFDQDVPERRPPAAAREAGRAPDPAAPEVTLPRQWQRRGGGGRGPRPPGHRRNRRAGTSHRASRLHLVRDAVVELRVVASAPRPQRAGDVRDLRAVLLPLPARHDVPRMRNSLSHGKHGARGRELYRAARRRHRRTRVEAQAASSSPRPAISRRCAMRATSAVCC